MATEAVVKAVVVAKAVVKAVVGVEFKDGVRAENSTIEMRILMFRSLASMIL